MRMTFVFAFGCKGKQKSTDRQEKRAQACPYLQMWARKRLILMSDGAWKKGYLLLAMRRYSDGVSPVSRLKALEKAVRDLKPTLSEMLSMVWLP